MARFVPLRYTISTAGLRVSLPAPTLWVDEADIVSRTPAYDLLREHRSELLDIRNGSMTYEEIVAYAESMDAEVRDVWYKKTKLRKKPDLKIAASLLMDVQDLIWENEE